jgi:hypothetical protein
VTKNGENWKMLEIINQINELSHEKSLKITTCGNSNPFLENSVIKIIHAIILTEKSATQLPQKVHEIVQQFSDR